ncbi:hypothetical protein GQ43DRAFT_459473 [Delitschia confertaspora ATCC 74209]|uniref:Uncharacterized protein n=1 Tax=Delitschia confertaspora ATCC 74209 TaxID=1513339 RepID=A0A9P4MXF7_9PLEO|nr:hypothetical protein GQ43DRAFT_459473 [Delitschia confertaspora ATCC 74209]
MHIPITTTLLALSATITAIAIPRASYSSHSHSGSSAGGKSDSGEFAKYHPSKEIGYKWDPNCTWTQKFGGQNYARPHKQGDNVWFNVTKSVEVVTKDEGMAGLTAVDALNEGKPEGGEKSGDQKEGGEGKEGGGEKEGGEGKEGGGEKEGGEKKDSGEKKEGGKDKGNGEKTNDGEENKPQGEEEEREKEKEKEGEEIESDGEEEDEGEKNKPKSEENKPEDENKPEGDEEPENPAMFQGAASVTNINKGVIFGMVVGAIVMLA